MLRIPYVAIFGESEGARDDGKCPENYDDQVIISCNEMTSTGKGWTGVSNNALLSASVSNLEQK